MVGRLDSTTGHNDLKGLFSTYIILCKALNKDVSSLFTLFMHF